MNATALGIMTKAIAASTYSLAWDTSAINGVSGPGKPEHPHPGHGHGPGKHLGPQDRVMQERLLMTGVARTGPCAPPGSRAFTPSISCLASTAAGQALSRRG